MPQSLGITGIFRKNQQGGGVYSVYRNLLRGFHGAVSSQPEYADLNVTVFHSAAVEPVLEYGFQWKQAPLSRNRFVSESLIGVGAASKLDAMLYPNYFLPPVNRARRSTVVLHDLQFRHFPEMFTRVKRAWLERSVRHAVSRADQVVTISSQVKGDVLRTFGDHLQDRITPIWNPIDLERLTGPVERDFTGGRPYVLGVAIDRPQKNLATLVRAFSKITDRYPDHRLVLAGKLRSSGQTGGRMVSAGDIPPATEVVRSLGLDDKVLVTGFVSDAELGALYCGADLFVLPSLFEGFGMPPVEAMSLGAPALVSDLPVLREVTLNQAQYIQDPLDAAALADQIAQILANRAEAAPSPELQQELRSHFAPDTIAQKYLGVLLPN